MKHLISQPLQPLGPFDTAAMVTGEPGLPACFRWQSQDHHITHIISTWKGISTDRTHGSSEQYLHKHWWQLQMNDDTIWTVYFDRQPRSRNAARWWLYTIEIPDQNQL